MKPATQSAKAELKAARAALGQARLALEEPQFPRRLMAW